MLPQPGLQAEEADVEIPWWWDLATRRSLAGVFIRAATGVVETPAHQAHLEERENGTGGGRSPPLQAPTSLVPSKASPIPHKAKIP